MEKKKFSFTARGLTLAVSAVACGLIGLILLMVGSRMIDRQTSQQMADRWSEKKDVSQISCFFSSNAGIMPERIEQFRYELEAALLQDSIVSQSPNGGARLWADAYSADGKIVLTSERASVTADAIGIGGDFFLFHPIRLLYGSYISEDDLNTDGCIIDEDAAWQLFGSNDVAGMMVEIQGVPHRIAGVVERDRSKLAQAAGLDATLVYVSYETLKEHGSLNGINHYELVMPNPVKGYAVQYVKEHIGTEEKEMELVENTLRFGFLDRIRILGDFGERSMNGKAIIYPYWENIARGVEDILTLLTLLAVLFWCYPFVVLCVVIVKAWKGKKWTLNDVRKGLQSALEDKAEEYRARRKRQKEYQNKFDEEEEFQ